MDRVRNWTDTAYTRTPGRIATSAKVRTRRSVSFEPKMCCRSRRRKSNSWYPARIISTSTTPTPAPSSQTISPANSGVLLLADEST